MKPELILVVEDDQVTSKVLTGILVQAGYQVVEAVDANAAFHAVQAQKPDLMILDLNLVTGADLNGIVDGFSLLHWLRYSLPDRDFPVIINTCDTSSSIDTHACADNVFAVFRKGDSLYELLGAVRTALGKAQQGTAV